MTLKRITFLQDLLAFMGLEGRLHLEWISSAEARKFVQVVTDFTRTIEQLGPNPLIDDFAADHQFNITNLNSTMDAGVPYEGNC